MLAYVVSPNVIHREMPSDGTGGRTAVLLALRHSETLGQCSAILCLGELAGSSRALLLFHAPGECISGAQQLLQLLRLTLKYLEMAFKVQQHLTAKMKKVARICTQLV